MVFLDGLHEDLNISRKHGQKISIKEADDEELNGHSKVIDHHKASEKAWERHLKLNNSKLVKLMQGQYISMTKSSKSDTLRRNFESFMCISVPLAASNYNNSCSIEECIIKFQENEAVDDFYDSKLKSLVPAEKTIRLWKCPKILIIHFKRFKSDQHGIREKLHTNIKLKKVLSIKESSTNQDLNYKLCSYVEHKGRTLTSGHYTSVSRHPLCKDIWHCFDDESVSQVRLDQILVSKTCYICFYILEGIDG